MGRPKGKRNAKNVVRFRPEMLSNNKSSFVASSPPVIHPKTGQVVAIYDGLCLKRQCATNNKKSEDGDTFPTLKVLMRKTDFNENRFDNNLSLKHVQLGMAFLCLSHYTGNIITNTRYFLINFELPSEVKMIRRKLHKSRAILVHSPALKREINVGSLEKKQNDPKASTSGFMSCSTSRETRSTSHSTSVQVQNLVEFESINADIKVSRKRKRNVQLLLEDYSGEVTCQNLCNDVTSENTDLTDENTEVTTENFVIVPVHFEGEVDNSEDASQDHLAEDQTSVTLLASQSSQSQSGFNQFLGQNVKKEPIHPSFLSFSELVRPETLDEPPCLWDMSEVEYIATFQSSFSLTNPEPEMTLIKVEPEMTFKEEIFSPPPAKKFRTGQSRISGSDPRVSSQIFATFRAADAQPDCTPGDQDTESRIVEQPNISRETEATPRSQRINEEFQSESDNTLVLSANTWPKDDSIEQEMPEFAEEFHQESENPPSIIQNTLPVASHDAVSNSESFTEIESRIQVSDIGIISISEQAQEKGLLHLKEAIEKLKSMNQGLTQQLESSRKESEERVQLELVNVRLRSELEASLNRLKDLQQVNQNLLIQRDDAENKIKQMESSKRELQNSMTQVLDINQKIGKANVLLKEEVKTLMQEPPGKATHMSSELVQRALKICSLEDQLSAAQAQSSTDKAEFLKLQAENANLKNQIDERINKFNQLEGSKDLLIRKLEGSKDQLIGQLEDAKLKLSQDSKTKETLLIQVEACNERIRDLESATKNFNSGKTKELESEIQSLNIMLELRDDLVRKQDQKLREITTSLQMKPEMLTSWNEMSEGRRLHQDPDAHFQMLKRGLEQLQDKLKTKDVKIRELEVELKFKREALDSNNKMWSDLLTNQAKQSGVKSLEFEMMLKQNEELKQKLEQVSSDFKVSKAGLNLSGSSGHFKMPNIIKPADLQAGGYASGNTVQFFSVGDYEFEAPENRLREMTRSFREIAESVEDDTGRSLIQELTEKQ